MSQGFTNNGINVTPQQIQQSAINVGIDSGAADAYVVTLSPPVSALTDGLLVQFVPLNNNLTGSPTLPWACCFFCTVPSYHARPSSRASPTGGCIWWFC